MGFVLQKGFLMGGKSRYARRMMPCPSFCFRFPNEPQRQTNKYYMTQKRVGNR